MGTGENASNQHFLLFPQCFLPFTKLLSHSGILLVRIARDRDFLYGLNVVRTKKYDCVRIFPLPYADLFNRINVACLTVPSIWGLVPRIFSNLYSAKSQIQCSRYTWCFFFKKVINGILLTFIFIHL